MPPTPDSPTNEVASVASGRSAHGASDGAARRFQVEDHLIVLEVGRLQPRLDAVGKSDDRDADAGDFAARR